MLEMLPQWLLVGVIVGLVFGIVRLFILKGQLKSIHKEYAANNYISGNLNLSESADLFLYTDLERKPRPKQEPPRK